MMAYLKTRTVGGERRYDVCWRAHGKSRSKTFTRLADAKTFKVDVERRAALGQLWEAEPVTLQEARDDWRSRWMIGKAASTVTRVDQAWPHVAAIAHVPLSDLRPAVLDDTYAAAARVAPRQAQLAAQTVKQVLRDAQVRGQKFQPELLTIKAASYDEREPVFLTFQEVEILASWCTQPHLILFLALSGLRIGEAVALRESDIDRGSHSVLVQRSASKGVEGATKTRKHRRVRLCERAWAALLEQLMARPTSVKGLVFPTPTGLLWDTDRFRARPFANAVSCATTPAAKPDDVRDRISVERREEVARLAPHDLRHTYASLEIAAGTHAKKIAEQMGHSDGGMLVLRRYGHLYSEAAERSVSALDRHLEAVAS